MSDLWQQAAVDHSEIFGDAEGPAKTATLTSPAGVSVALRQINADIALVVDPGTGMVVSGRTASVAFRMTDIIAEGLTLPEGVADSSRRPWTVDVIDTQGDSYTFKVVQTYPDRTLGLVTCDLEAYKR